MLNANSLTGTVGVAQLPGSVVTNNWASSAGAINLTNDVNQTGTNRVTKLRVGGAAESAASLAVNGNAFVSGYYNAGGEFTSGSTSPSGTFELQGLGGSITFWDGSGNIVARIKGGIGSLTLTTNVLVAGTLTATNGVVLPQRTTAPALAQPGAQLWSDGTNLCVILQDAGGNRTTNKCTLTAWP